MKVVLVTQWFPPEPAYLWEELATDLANLGHEVTVVTAFPNYPYGKIYDGYQQKFCDISFQSGYKLIRLPTYPDRSTSIIKRAISYISFSVAVLGVGIFKIPKCDIILSYSPPLTVVVSAAIISRIKKVPLVVNIQDMWPDTLISSGMIKKGFVANIIDTVANWIYREASAVVVISSGFKAHLENKGVAKEKVQFISNWSDDCQHKDVAPHVSASLRERLGINQDDFVVMFAGNMGPAQGLDSVVDAAIELSSQRNIKFLFVGDGLSLQGLQSRVSECHIVNVVFAGRVNASEMYKYYGICDALLIHLKRDPLFEITIPHKLLTYLMVGKPIVSAVNGEVNAIVESAGAGSVCQSEDFKGIANAVLDVANYGMSEKNDIRKSASTYFQQNFSRSNLMVKWDLLIRELTYGIESCDGR
jgi:glycosyltransferase involved in cell wall biosynthesis